MSKRDSLRRKLMPSSEVREAAPLGHGGRHIAHRDVADGDAVERDGRDARHAVGGGDGAA